MRAKTLFSRLNAWAAVLAVAGGGLLISEVANAQTSQPPPSGTIAFNPATGSNVTIVFGTPSGPCNVSGASEYSAVVAGPGAFAPDPTQGRPDGVTFRGASDVGFQTTTPIAFNARLSFQDLALELGLTEVPVGDYVVTFRCVDDVGTIFQTYRSTITFTTPTTYTSQSTSTPTPAPGTPTPATPTPTPAPETPTPTPTPTPAPETPTPTPTPATPTPPPGGVQVTTTKLSVFPNPAIAGFPMVAVVRLSSFAAEGTVQLKDGDKIVGDPLPVFDGFAFSFLGLPVGSHSLTAVFTPDDPTRYAPSTSQALNLRVRSLFSFFFAAN